MTEEFPPPAPGETFVTIEGVRATIASIKGQQGQDSPYFIEYPDTPAIAAFLAAYEPDRLQSQIETGGDCVNTMHRNGETRYSFVDQQQEKMPRSAIVQELEALEGAMNARGQIRRYIGDTFAPVD